MSLTTTYQEFSEFELEQMNIRIDGETQYEESGAVGSVEETMDVKSVIKKYKGVEAKNRTKGTGTGTLKYSMHMNYEKYKKLFGMEDEALVKGVAAYGQPSTHKKFGITELVLDEDGVKKFKAYPNCMIKSSPSNKIQNATEEVAEIELEVSFMPDQYGYGMYEAIYDELEEDVKEKWMVEFTPELVRVPQA